MRRSKRHFTLVLTLLVTLSACAFDGSFFLPEEQSPVTTPLIAPQASEGFSFTSHDGTSVHGLHMRSSKEPKATIYLFHGSGENIYGWQEVATPLVAAGYDVIMMDYRGFGHSDGKPTHRNALSDARQMVQFVEGRVRTSTKVLMGQSYGGQIAIHLAHDDKDHFDALITEGTFTSHRDEVIASVPTWLKPLVGLVAASPYKARELISEVTIPKLIIHSRDDQQVPYWMGQALYEEANGRREFWRISGRHALGLLEMPDRYVARVDDFIMTNTVGYAE